MIEVACHANAGSKAARDFLETFGGLDGGRTPHATPASEPSSVRKASDGASPPVLRARPTPLSIPSASANGVASLVSARLGGDAEAPARLPRSLESAASTEMADALALAMAQRRLPNVVAELRRGIDGGLCTGAQLSVYLRGEGLLHLWEGEVRPGVPMRRDMLCNWMSTTKPVAVVAIAQLWERRLIDLGEPVATYIPEFGCNGKDQILIEHLLTHTAGIPYADVKMWPSLHKWDKVLAAISYSNIEPEWAPGKRAGYHAYSAWFVLGELVQRLDGRPFAQYVREEIFVPLGMVDCHVGMSDELFEAYKAEGRLAELRTLAAGGVPLNGKLEGVTDKEVTACVPGSNGRGPAEQWLSLFQMLLDEGLGPGGTRLLQPATVRGLSRRYRVGMYDEVQGVVCDWSLGLSVASTLSGAHASPDTFGHGGSQSSVGFCDPEHKLAVVIVTNARPGPKLHYERMHRLSTLLYEDLGLVPDRDAKAATDPHHLFTRQPSFSERKLLRDSAANAQKEGAASTTTTSAVTWRKTPPRERPAATTLVHTDKDPT